METLNDEFYGVLRKKAREYHKEAGAHGFDHVERVYYNALKILEDESLKNSDIDEDIVKASALLHDVARKKESKKQVKCHAEEGSEMCKEILREIGFPENKIEGVSYSIKVHRYSKKIIPETMEAKILQDADRLDALGAISVGRIFGFGGKKNRLPYNPEEDLEAEYVSGSGHSSIAHFHKKIFKILPDNFHTEKARKMAVGRYNFVKEFVDRYIKEWNGEL